MIQPTYSIQRAASPPRPGAGWEDPVWEKAHTLAVDNFHPQSSDHRPVVKARLLYDTEAIHGIFRVEDRYVICTHMEYQQSVCRDSCVEFFVKPASSPGYQNFEMNCCGTLLTQFIRDPERVEGGFRDAVQVPPEIGRKVQVRGSLNGPITEEIKEPTVWTVQFRIPLEVLEEYAGPIGDPCGQEWRANFYKCADQSSHPHWASWAPVGERLNFHQPDKFAPLYFD